MFFYAVCLSYLNFLIVQQSSYQASTERNYLVFVIAVSDTPISDVTKEIQH